MTNSLFASFLNNITLLLALGFLHSFCAARWGDWRTLRGRMVGGFLFGAVAIAGMIFPLHYSPGLTFDGRAILLSIVGLFGGWQAASIAVLMTGALRIWQGGIGQWVGLATILTSAGLGVLFYELRARYAWNLDLKLLFGFGWVVHGVMLSCMLFLPVEVRWTLLADITAPVLIIYPLATTLFGGLLMGLEEQNLAAERLLESEAKYRQLFEMESDALFLIDNRTGEIYDANLAAVSLYGYSRDELLRMKNTDLSAEPDETRNASVRAISAGTVQIPLRFHRKKDGTVFPVEIMATSLVWKGLSVHIPAIRDITERKQSEAALRRNAEVQAVLREIAESVLVAPSLDELYERVCQLIGKVLPAQHFHINLLDEANKEIFVPFNADSASAIPRRRPVGKGMTEYVMRTGRAMHVTPAELDRLIETGEFALAKEQKILTRHYLGAPLFDSAGNPFGVIALTLEDETAAFHPDDADILSIIAAQVSMAIGIIRDITDKLEKRQRIEYLSFHDQLTGLYNRRFYEEELKRLSTDRNLPLTLVIADVNGLKLTNDAFGHAAGDHLLRKLASILKEVCRQDDIVARIGGDEFILLLPRTDAAEAEGIITRISQAILREQKELVILSASFGWATKTSVGKEMQDVFKEAEDKMYRNKLSESDSVRNNTIHVIVRTLNEKNAREEMHSSRVSEICRSIGRAMALNPHEINGLKTMGLLHDIGKIGIDEKVLNKEGKLTEEEWREMKRHSEIGFRILGAVTDFSHLARAVLEHHERWDGSGYPKGLAERDICLEARILAVADCYDAMTQGRPYRKEMSQAEAVAELKCQAGKQYDPMVVRIFVEKVLGEPWDSEKPETA